MSKFITNVIPGNTETVRVEGTSIKGSYILIDPSKSVLPLGSGRLKVSHEVRKGGIGATMLRFSIPWTDDEGVTREATHHEVATNEVIALLNGITDNGAYNPGTFKVANSQLGAHYVARRLCTILSAANSEFENDTPYSIDALDINDPSGLAAGNAASRMGNLFIRAALGLEPLSEASQTFGGTAGAYMEVHT